MGLDLTIRPRIGLGDLKFGAAQAETQKYLGKPESVEGLDQQPFGWVTWQYPSIGVDASFDEEYAFRLVSLTATIEKITLFGQRYIGLHSKTALEKAVRSPLGPYQRVEDPLGWEAEFEDADLEFRFDDDLLWLISWRVLIDKQDVVHWPD